MDGGVAYVDEWSEALDAVDDVVVGGLERGLGETPTALTDDMVRDDISHRVTALHAQLLNP